MWLGLAWLGCSHAEPVVPEHWQVAEIRSEAIDESSGLVRSRRHPDVYWTHNDSGDLPRIFAIDAGGETLAEFAVDGAENFDWEDLAIDDAGRLYLADTGNNMNRRENLAIYVIAEPDPATGGGAVPVERRLPFRYADQVRLGDRLDMNYDCEALFWRDGILWLFTKHRSNGRTKLYRLDPALDHEQVIAPVARYELGGPLGFLGSATAADQHPDGERLALLTYFGAFLFTWPPGAAPPSGPSAFVPLDPDLTRQAESLAWSGDALVVGNEQRSLFRIPDPFAPMTVERSEATAAPSGPNER